MTDAWGQFGFSTSPYRSKPLEANEHDFLLHVGRDRESAKFQTQVDQKGGGIIVISGDIGLGKTSFLNIQQYLLYTKRAAVGPRLLVNRVLTSVAKTDTTDALARRIVHNMILGIEKECLLQNKDLPTQAAEVRKWMSHEGTVSGRSFGFSLFGVGASAQRSVSVPAVGSAGLENWKSILELLVVEAKSYFGVDGALLCIDNTETLSIERLTEILMFYRDTLLITEDIWWVIVGQRNLYAKIDSVDRRISQRITGTGIEIEPLSSEGLHELVETRIQRLRSDSSAKSPLSKKIHDLLYAASCGQPRYVLDAADTLFIDIITEVRIGVLEQQKKEKLSEAREHVEEMIHRTIEKYLLVGGVPDNIAEALLRNGVLERLRARGLASSHLMALRTIGTKGSKRPGRASRSAGSASDLPNGEILEDLLGGDLIYKIEDSEPVTYRLKGDAWLCNHYNMWELLARSSRM
jgi:hypothetical protein